MAKNVFYLHFLENEDEAQMTGYKFLVEGNFVTISQTFHHPEYEEYDKPLRMTRVEAREFWRKSVQSGMFKPVN